MTPAPSLLCVQPLMMAYGNLLGPDMAIMLIIRLAMFIGVIAAVVFLVRRGGARPMRGVNVHERLRRLDALHASGTINAAEHQKQRQRILNEV